MIRASSRVLRCGVLVLFAAASGCASAPGPAAPAVQPSDRTDVAGRESATRFPSAAALAVVDAALWMQTSAEYAALSRQTWATAARLLPEAIADTAWSAALEQGPGAGALPPAVIVDVDETVLDNSAYAARLVERDESFSEESWAAWVNEAQAPPVPGAVEFARRARELGVEVFYVTNRLANLEEGTRRNLRAVGFPPGTPEDVYLLKDEREAWGSDKTSRRAWVAEHYRVLMLAGDDLNDFTPEARRTTVEARKELVDRHAEKWGSRWFAFANPTYGSWVSALLLGLESPSADDVTERKLESLEPAWRE